MAQLVADFRLALRNLGRSPGFAVAAVLTLAVGLGSNVLVFSLVNSLLLRPLAYPEPERLVAVWQDLTERGGPQEEWSGRSVFTAWRERNRSFESMAAVSGWSPDLSGVDVPDTLTGAAVTPDYFSTLGVQPHPGRGFLPEDGGAQPHKVVVIGHGLWQKRFGGDPGIVGRTITLNGSSFTVIGVAPAAFRHFLDPEVEVWAPLPMDTSRPDYGNFFLRVVGRLRPGVSREAADADLDRISRELGVEAPDYMKGAGSRLVPLQESLNGPARLPLLAANGAVALVLLIVCANLANLLLVRASSRQGELAVRSALGAGGGRLVAQLLTESLVLAVAGGAVGLALARWGLALVRQSGPQELLRLAEIRLDGPVLAFAAGLVVATTLLFGLLPALGASRRAGALGQASRSRVGASHGRLREGLIVVEIALGLALLVNAGLLVRSLGSLMRVSPGFSAQGVLSASLNFPPALLPEEHQVVERMEAIESALAARPGIEAVGATRVLPLSGNQFDLSFVLEGQAVTPGQEPAADFRAVTPGYFGTLAIPLRRGRLFTAADRDGATPVALVSERFVEQFFPGQDPLGRRMKIGDTDQDAPWWTIVGVVGGVRDNRLDRAPDAEMYIPNAQHAARRMRLVVRSPLPTAELVREVRQAVASVDPHQVVSGMVPMAELVDRSLASARFLTSLLGVFAVLALVLAVVGVYGVVAYSMGLRRQEMAVRLALGATREAISQLVLGWGARRLVLGLVGGLALALAMARALASLLYRVAPWDPATLGLVSILLAAAALGACWLPARRAARTDPMATLRQG